MKTHSTLSEKFKPLYYEHFDVTGSCSLLNDPIPSAILKHPSSPNKDKGSNSGSLPFVEDSFPTNSFSKDTNPLSGYLKSLCNL